MKFELVVSARASYRAIFTITLSEVHVLAVRRATQDRLTSPAFISVNSSPLAAQLYSRKPLG